MNNRMAKAQNARANTLRSATSRLLIFALCLLSFAAAVEAAPSQARASKAKASKAATVYVCPMHPDVRSTRQGKCPRCGMALRAAKDEPDADKVSTSGERAAGAESPSIKLSQIPDTTVYDQNGRKLRFYNDLVKGKTVAIQYIFTTCTTICPPLAATFRKVQQQLGDRVGRDVQLISISVDPTTDVPERLKAFSEKFQAGAGWTFVTGNKPEIDTLLKALGAATVDKNDHTPMVLVGNDGAGYWTRTYGLAPAATLVKVIIDAADGQPAAASVQVPVPGAKQNAAQGERQVQRQVANSAQANSAQAASPEAKPSKSPAEAAAGYFTNTVLLTQEGKPVRFYDDMLKGKTVLINFMFTTCTGICPPMTANLAKVQAYLGDRVGKDINMISLTVDPLTDTPEALKKYATNFKVKPGWYFLTGDKANVSLVLRKVGGYVEDKNDHSGILIIGNVETGEWVKVFAMAKPAEIADGVLKLAGPKKE